ncbi:MAG: GxxExxY protein [Chitinophagaceae bacterium]|nr:GxxExxY protein [Chitinophagaceae bacterium]
MAELILKEESYKVVGICMNIHSVLGMGLKEVNYKDAMEMDFVEAGIPFEREKKFSVRYKNKVLYNPYYADFLVFDSMIVEVKSVSSLTDAHMAQALSYLAVSGMKLALLINFGEHSLISKRIVF